MIVCSKNSCQSLINFTDSTLSATFVLKLFVICELFVAQIVATIILLVTQNYKIYCYNFHNVIEKYVFFPT